MTREEALNECVSRDKAIVQLNHLQSDWDDDWNVAIRKCIETIKNLPSVTPQQKMGRWILQPSNKEQGERDFIWWKCSECGQVIYSETEQDRRKYHAYCGMCGCKMKEVEG